MNGKLYITTTIPYVNATPHVGFALELTQADAIARYHRLRGKEVRFQTGTDENAFKNVAAARERGLETRTFVDSNAARFLALAEALGVSHDAFVRTTEARHALAVHRLWADLRPSDVFRKGYDGLYCPGCEDFLLERDLVNGRCPDHGVPPTSVSEENWFFRLSAYQAELDNLIADGRLQIVPESRRNEVLAFIRRGLADISISRSADRAGGWGIAVPGDPTQVVYVWIDALANYLTGLGYGLRPDWAPFWGEGTRKVHVFGKNVWKFHAVYWPALLFSAGLPLPDALVVHGFLTEGGRKISKSSGNAIDPFGVLEATGADALRYYLLRGIPPFEDGDFSPERLRRLHDTELSNELGNLVSRLTALCCKAGFHERTAEEEPDAPDGYHEAWERFAYDEAIGALRCVVVALNRRIDEVRPWELLKAVFAADLATNSVPHWWLAQYGFTNFNTDALGDADQDGLSTWEEWVAGCEPTSSNSVFRFTGASSYTGQAVVVRWPSVPNRFYDLRRATNILGGTNAFIIVPGASNMPATPAMKVYTDTVSEGGPYFYRVDVHE